MGKILRKVAPEITRSKFLHISHRNLLMSIQALPGVHVQSYNINTFNLDVPIYIFLHTEECTQEGLFFLTRSVDDRYWEYGQRWEIKLSVGDSIYPNGDRPLSYYLMRKPISGDTFESVTKEIESLIENLNSHYYNQKFMAYYNMNPDEYSIVNETQFDRNEKINSLGL
jgi:hypothetical protein